MPADRRVHDALAVIREQIEARATEMRDLMESANRVARAAGLPLPYPKLPQPTLEPEPSKRRPETPPDAAGLAVHKAVRPGQFAHHRTPSAAIRAYLDWRGPRTRGATLDELQAALLDGDFPFELKGERARSVLRAAVTRDPDVVRTRSGLYGLSQWSRRR